MTDKELLEKAAKAAGVFLTPKTLAEAFPKWEWEDSFCPRYVEGVGMLGTVVVYSYSGELSGTTTEECNPLADDGDALRLMVKMGMIVESTRPGSTIVSGWFHGSPYIEVDHNGDPYKATRRAIVLVAAALADQQ